MSGQVAVRQGGFRLDRRTGRLVQEVTMTNNGTTAIQGPVLLEIRVTAGNVTLFNSANSLLPACQSTNCPSMALLDLGRYRKLQQRFRGNVQRPDMLRCH